MTHTKKYTIGADIGGTNMKAVLWDGDKVLESYNLATSKDNLDHFLIMLKALIDPLLDKAKKDKAKISGLGIGIAGLYDINSNRVTKSPNIPILDGVDLASKVKETLGMEPLIDNDANCFVRAQALKGVAKKYDNIFGLTIGTGIGGGWWINGKVYRGSRGGAGEIKTMIIDDSREIEEIYKKLSQGNSANLAEEAYRGDDLAKRSFQEMGYYLGLTCANVINLLDPEAIVIGGGTMKAADLFFAKLKKTAYEFTMHPEAKKVKILKAKSEDDIGAIGAALQIE